MALQLTVFLSCSLSNIYTSRYKEYVSAWYSTSNVYVDNFLYLQLIITISIFHFLYQVKNSISFRILMVDSEDIDRWIMSVWHEIQGKSWNKCMHVRQGISILGSLYHDCVMAWRMAVVFSQQWKGNRAFSSVYHGLDGTKNSRIFTPMKKQRNILMDDGIAWCS